MQPVMSVFDVREMEASLDGRGTGPDVLMRRAGAVVAMQAARMAQGGPVVVLCGAGNNGGDGWACADELARHGYDVAVVSAAAPAAMGTPTARDVARRAAEMGVPVHVSPDEESLARLLGQAAVVVDAMFGIGFHGELPQPYAGWVSAIDDFASGSVLSVDVPSGVDATTGEAAGAHVVADCTVTMFAAKPGLLSGVGRLASGSLAVAGLASSEDDLQRISDSADAFVLDEMDYVDVFPEQDPAADKYGRGRVLVVAGSVRYPGAAVLAAKAAVRSGAGYVTLAVPEPVVPVAQAHLLSVPVVGLPADSSGAVGSAAVSFVADLATKADVVVAGPGLTTGDGAFETVRALLGSPAALVLDADALNLLVRICAGSAEANPEALRRDAALVLTPHRRELARLLGADPARTSSLAGAVEGSQALAWAVGSSNFAVVAKGDVTSVTGTESTLVVAPGPSALGTAGTGDVLAGLTAGLLAQSVAGDQVATDGSELLLLLAGADRVHAVAGELACADKGSRGIAAPDVAERVGLAFDALLARAEQDYENGARDEGARLEEDLDFEDETRVALSPEARAALGAAATADALVTDDEPLEEPESPEEQQARLERAQRAADVRRAKVASPDAPVPAEIEMPAAAIPAVRAQAQTAPTASQEEPQAGDGEGGGAAALAEGHAGDAAQTTVMAPVSAGEDRGAREAPGADGAAGGGEPGAQPAADQGSDPDAAPHAAPGAEGRGGQDGPAAGEGDGVPAGSGAEDDAGDAPGADNAEDAAADDSVDEGDAGAGEPPAADSAGVPGGAPSSSDDAPLLPGSEAVPPFLARAVSEEISERERQEDLEREKVARRRLTALEEFHRKATRHAGVTPRVPPEERPSARGKSRGGRQGQE